MAANDLSDTGLHDKLREQVAASVKEALNKSTAILSNLHRLSSYLDVMSAMSGGDAQGPLKNALQQIQSVRTDSSSLLQTIYLGEIGLQSMADVSKTASPGGGSGAALSMFSSSADPVAENSHDDMYADTEGDSLGKHSSPQADDNQPKSKKMAISLYTCQGCDRKFATNMQDDVPTHCKNCRSINISSSTAEMKSSSAPSVSVLPSSGIPPSFTSTPIGKGKLRMSKRKKLQPLLCKICGISFFYRRCLLRHIRECHAAVIDQSDLQQYVHLGVADQEGEETDSTMESMVSQSSSLNVNVGSDLSAQTSVFNLTDQAALNHEEEEVSGHRSGQAPVTVSMFAQGDNGVPTVSTAITIDSSIDNSQGPPPPPLPPADAPADAPAGANGSSNFREFRCTVCDKPFDRPYRLTRHLEIHDPNRPRMPCSFCNKTFTRKDSMESHIRSAHTANNTFTCEHQDCNKTFSSRSIYLSHLKVHGDTKPYHCQECSMHFTLLFELKEHLKTEHVETEETRCPECFKVFSSVKDLENHKLTSHRFECEVCGKVFARMGYLHNHFKVHNGESIFNCRYCSEGFNSIYHYQQHLKSHPESRRPTNVYPCHTCDKVFDEPSSLVAHYQTTEHREKAIAIGISPTSSATAISLMEGELSVQQMVNEEAMKTIVEEQTVADYEGIDPQDIAISLTQPGNATPKITQVSSLANKAP